MRVRSLLTVLTLASVCMAASATAEEPTTTRSSYPPMVVDESVPNVRNEDSLTKMERLDALSMQTHRQLSIARTQGQPKETIEKLEKKIEAINEQRVATMKKLRVAH